MEISIHKHEVFYSEEEALACQAQHEGAEITARAGHGIMLHGKWTYDIPENRPSWTVSWEEPQPGIVFDPADLDGMRRLMDEHGDSKNSFDAVNEEMEPVSISIAKDRIDTVTFQSNGRTRHNVYWRDGTREELFEGEWR